MLGILSALVLFVASFPDHDADRAGGRKTLVIVLGRERASKLYWLFLVASPAVLFCGVYLARCILCRLYALQHYQSE